MPAPAFLSAIAGLRNGVPNNADVDSATSVAISTKLLELVMGGAPASPFTEKAAGSLLEVSVEHHLRDALDELDPSRDWIVSHKRQVAQFTQYRHLARLNELVKADATLRVELGGDYVIRPDVTVGVAGFGTTPFLHAAVSCKWTIRSDRVQNIRHEAMVLTRNRRGRLPHIVAVTAEPLPTRLASIAMGTGEVDAVYHVALDELTEAVDEVCRPNKRLVHQAETLALLVGQQRLLDFTLLAENIAMH